MISQSIARGSSLLWQARDLMQQQLSDLAYRLRPDQPLEGLVYLPIADRAAHAYFPRAQALKMVVWNTFKGRRAEYYSVLEEQTRDAELILLQEFRHDPALEAAHRGMFMQREAGLAVSFYTQRNQGAPTGVCTVSCVRSLKTLFLLSRYFEPVTRTPKMAMCSYYAVGRADCPLDEALLVLNSHGINFRLRRPFLDQMRQFEDQLRNHRGPIVLVGDFNTWEQGRVRILDAVAESICLKRVRFPAGVKRVRGHELDRVYVRGGEVSQEQVHINPAASDHNMLSFALCLD